MWIFLENVAAIAIIFFILFIIWNVLELSRPYDGGISLDDLPEPDEGPGEDAVARVFQVGDRVRYTSGGWSVVGTVEEYESSSNIVSMRLDDNTGDYSWMSGRLWLTFPDQLELIAEKEPPVEEVDKGDTFITLNELGTMMGIDMSSEPEADDSIPVGTYVQITDPGNEFSGENGRVIDVYRGKEGDCRYYVELNDDESVELFPGNHLKVINDSDDSEDNDDADTDLYDPSHQADNTHEVPPGTMSDLLGSGPDLCRLCACSGICEQQNFLAMVQEHYDITVGVHDCPEFVTHDEAESAEWILTLGERGKNNDK